MPPAINNTAMVLFWDVRTRSGLLKYSIVKIRDSQWLENMWDLYERGNCHSGGYRSWCQLIELMSFQKFRSLLPV